MIGLGSGRNNGNRYFINTITAINSCVFIAINAIGGNGSAMPVENLPLRQFLCLITIERHGFIQINTLYPIATACQRNRVVHNGRGSICDTVPGDRAAESDGADSPLNRHNGKYQFVNTVLPCSGLIGVIVMAGFANPLMTKSCQIPPRKIVSFADTDGFYKMIFCFVFSQYQSP